MVFPGKENAKIKSEAKEYAAPTILRAELESLDEWRNSTHLIHCVREIEELNNSAAADVQGLRLWV
jgi:hypothetical protein